MEEICCPQRAPAIFTGEQKSKDEISLNISLPDSITIYIRIKSDTEIPILNIINFMVHIRPKGIRICYSIIDHQHDMIYGTTRRPLLRK